MARDVDRGRDPAAEAQKARAAERAAPTIEEFGERYIEDCARPRKASWRDERSVLRAWVYPKIGRIKVPEAGPRNLTAVLDGIREAGHARQAVKAKVILSRVFHYAKGRGLIETNPARDLEVPHNRPRERTLGPDRVRAWWSATAEGVGMPESTRLALRFLLLTGQRPSEVLGMRVGEVEWEAEGGPVWSIPPDRRKRGRRAHRLPLPPEAVRVLETACERVATEGYVFPDSTGQAPERVDGRPRKYLQTVTKSDLGLHDARRLLASELADSLGYGEDAIGRVLGHYPASVTQGYIVNSQETARRALAAWESRVLELVGEGPGAEVIRLA